MSGTNSLGLVLIPAVLPGGGQSGAFAGLPQATLQQLLANAQTALGNLLSGAQSVVLSYGEGTGQKSVTYLRTNEAALRHHIAELQILLGNRPRRAAIRVL